MTISRGYLGAIEGLIEVVANGLVCALQDRPSVEARRPPRVASVMKRSGAGLEDTMTPDDEQRPWKAPNPHWVAKNPHWIFKNPHWVVFKPSDQTVSANSNRRTP